MATMDELETQLAELAVEFRESIDGTDVGGVVAEYARVMHELFTMPDWSGEPEVDSMLPIERMPEEYHDYWKRIRNV